MQHPETGTGPFGPHWGEKEQTVFALVPLMTEIEVSHILGIPNSTGNLVSHVRADGNGNMSSIMSKWKLWSSLSLDSHGPVPEILVV